jgi:anti-sigma factor RsiW
MRKTLRQRAIAIIATTMASAAMPPVVLGQAKDAKSKPAPAASSPAAAAKTGAPAGQFHDR